MITDRPPIKQQVQKTSGVIRHNIERILCPTDLSLDSNQGLAYAVSLAQSYGARLYLCHCVEELPAGRQGQIEKQFKTLISQHVATGQKRKDLKWEGIVTEGDATFVTLREARQQKVDLIVMHSRRRPYIAALLGSNAEAICRAAPCPVLITHSRERDWIDPSNGAVNLRRVLVAYDFSEFAEQALSYGLYFAQEYQAELHLLHVIPPQLPEEDSTKQESTYQLISRELKQVVPAETFLWCNVQWNIREGMPYHEVLNYAQERGIDLICMGAQGKGYGKWSLFGSNSDRVLRQAPCPVLIARPTLKD
jgi:nucleotide-binding universal stress UspA family protein